VHWKNCKQFATLQQMETAKPKGDGKKTCLVCGRSMKLVRGLCRSHHKHFTECKKAIEDRGDNSRKWETAVIKRGFILADGRTPENVFMDIFLEISGASEQAAEDPESYKMPTAADAAEIIADAAKSGGVRKTNARKKKAE
jgi:ribosomal protein S14